VIGGTAPGAGNLISGNTGAGVFLRFAQADQVEGNYIGTDFTGTKALGNQTGVMITGSRNVVGGTTAGAGNLISGNGGAGVEMGGQGVTGNQVQGNQIGTDVSGTQALGNAVGVQLDAGASADTIGGTAAGSSNTISGNSGDGIDISGASGNVVQGNLIGTDVSGTAALGNGSDGVAILNGSDNTVGGTTTAAANVISANGGSGVLISGANAMSNLLAGNFLGTDASATLNLGNAANGVTIQNASNNLIGGTAAGAGNVIAFNGNDGVLVDTGTGNAILSDLFFANGNLGIELSNNGNNNQAASLLTGAFSDGPNTVIQGVLLSTPNTTFTVQLFSDPSTDPNGLAQGQQLLATVTVTTDAFGFAPSRLQFPRRSRRDRSSRRPRRMPTTTPRSSRIPSK
jgi:titin